jgi:hypothetical protein
MMAVGLIRALFQFLILLFALGLFAGIVGGVWRWKRGVVLPPEELRHRRRMRGPEE